MLIGIVAFALQIYADFAGYSSIARGLARLMGFELMLNFRLPYFALNPSDFWSRWHISLSTWLRDYLYIPLGGNRRGPTRTHVNLMLTMLLGGLWHGAAWNFVLWGAFHGLILILYRLFERNPIEDDPWGRASRLRVFAKMALMLALTLLGWVFFRGRSVEQITYLLTNVGIGIGPDALRLGFQVLFFAAPMLAMEIWQYRRRDLLAPTRLPAALRIPLYGLLFVWVVIFGVRESMEFIYFQF